MADPLAAKTDQIEVTTRSPSGADLVLLLLLILFGFGIWAGVEWGIAELLRSREPTEQKFLEAYDVPNRKAELAYVQNEIAEIQKYLNAARLEQLKQNAAVQSFLVTYPELEGFSQPSGAVTPEIRRGYLESIRQRQAARDLVSSLEEHVATRKQQAKTLSSELDTKQETAESQFRRANGKYVFLKRGATFFVTLAIVAVLLWLVRLVLWAFAKKRMSTAEGFRPFVWALAALALLFAYDQFSYAGAALVGVLLLLFILRRIKWPRHFEAPANE